MRHLREPVYVAYTSVNIIGLVFERIKSSQLFVCACVDTRVLRATLPRVSSTDKVNTSGEWIYLYMYWFKKSRLSRSGWKDKKDVCLPRKALCEFLLTDLIMGLCFVWGYVVYFDTGVITQDLQCSVSFNFISFHFFISSS